MNRLCLAAWMLLAVVPGLSIAQDKKEPDKKAPDKKEPDKKKEAPKLPTPTAANFKYGEHERNVMDFWKAESTTPTPVLFYIHGGGWQGGDKSSVGAARIDACLKAGISVAAINYRYVKQAVEQKVEPPVKAPLHDAARALQTLRSKAGEWNIDKKRIGATGGSAGACSSLWLAFHDDLADPKSSDPIARESTRLYCAAVDGAQVTLDPKPLREWIPNYTYGAHAFGQPKLDDVLAKRDELMKWIKEYSPMENVTKDDPPICLVYGGAEPKKGDSPKDPTHSGIMGLMLMEKLKEAGVEGILICPGHPHEKYKSSTDYLVDRLKK